MTPRLQRAAGGLLFGLLLLHLIVASTFTLRVLRHTADFGWTPTSQGETVRVLRVRAPAAPVLRVGDQVLAVDGRGLAAAYDLREIFQHKKPSETYRVLLLRDGRLHLIEAGTARYGMGWATFFPLVSIGEGFVFLLAGVALFLLGPENKPALLLALAFALFVTGDNSFYSSVDRPGWAILLNVAVNGGSAFLCPVLLHFFLLFPETSPVLRRFPWLERMLYVPALALLLPLVTFQYLLATDMLRAFAFLRGAAVLEWGLRGTWLTYIAAGLVSLVVSYRSATRPSRRKLRVVVAGSLLGFGPWLGLSILPFFVEISSFNAEILRGLVVAAFLALPLVPLSFGYAIVRHQVIPLRMLLRRGARYLLVSRGFVVIQAAVILGLIFVILTGSRARFLDDWGPRADVAATLLLAGAAYVGLRAINRRVRGAIDRRFFREAYDGQRLVADVGQAVRDVPDVHELVARVVETLRDTFHVESASVFLRPEGSSELTRVHATRHPAGGGADPMDSVLDGEIRSLIEGSPRPLSFTGTGPWLLGAELLVPIVTRDQTQGVLALGPRLSEIPFSSEDQQFLSAVAWQMGFAVENARQVGRRAEEERLRREIEIAADVQRRLFPARAPDGPDLELSGLCLPAREVGGDYYDFLALPEGKVGIAVADVAGKGISAALLMSIVQASLRSQAPSTNGDLARLVSSMNQLLFRSTAPNGFASFFYAQFDAATRRLSYVNAGHNPPMLLRAGSAPRLLREGGIVIGAAGGSEYRQASVELESGDVFVAYTDGLTEAWNPAEEHFGEGRLKEAVDAALHLPAEEISRQVVAAVETWCQGSPPHDDLTLVVAKVR